MKKKILTVLLASVLFYGTFAEAPTVYAKETGLTFRYETAGEKEEEVLKELLADYTKQTGVIVEEVSGEADVYMGSLADLTEQYKKGELYNLYSDTEKESPYSDSVTWGSELPDEIRKRIQVYKREVPGYPAARTAVRLFCNEELFEKAGVEIPDTWSELLKVCESFREQGIEPFIFPESGWQTQAWQWLMNFLCSQMDSNLADVLDETEDRYVELAEACKGADKGVMDFSRPQLQEALKCMKEFYDLCSNHESSVNEEKGRQLFSEGNAAMILAVNEDAEDLEGDFSWRAIPIPFVTEEYSEYASGLQILAGGEVSGFYGMSISLIGNEEKKKACLDFIQYMTSVEVQERMAAEAGILPSAENAELPGKMEDFKVVEEPLRMSYFTGLDEENRGEIWEALEEYLTGKTELASLTEKLNRSCQKAAQRIREENGWTLINNYGMPTVGECTKCAP